MMLNYCKEKWFVKSRVVLFLLVANGLPFFRHCWGGTVKNMKWKHTHRKHNILPSTCTDHNKPQSKLAEHRDYFSTANFQTKITATFRGTFGIFRRFWKLSFIYSTISRGNPNHVVWSPGWRTPKSNTKIDNAHVVGAQNSTQIYLCTYTHTHTHTN